MKHPDARARSASQAKCQRGSEISERGIPCCQAATSSSIPPLGIGLPRRSATPTSALPFAT
jgi:hypothetical protein